MKHIFNIKIYSEEEKQELWDKLAKEIHSYNASDRTREELIKYVKELESEVYKLRCDRNYYYRLSRKADYYRNKAHVYKVELGRCVRKLTRIYEKQMQLAVLAYSLGRIQEKPHEYVDRWKRV